jgi:gas vesicle protein
MEEVSSMGYIRGVVHGAIAGTVLGICIAPQPGEKTRQQLAAFGRAAHDGYDVAQRTAKQMAPVVSAAAHMAKEQVAKVRHSDEDSDAVSVEGNVRIHADGNGHSHGAADRR